MFSLKPSTIHSKHKEIIFMERSEPFLGELTVTAYNAWAMSHLELSIDGGVIHYLLGQEETEKKKTSRRLYDLEYNVKNLNYPNSPILPQSSYSSSN